MKIVLEARCTIPGALNDWPQEARRIKLSVGAASLQTGLSQTGLAVDPTMMDWLSPIRTDVFEAEFYSAEFRVTGVFGSLPGGPLGLAAGYAFRSDSGGRDSAQSVNAGETVSLGTVNDYDGRQTVDSLYAEVALPITDTLSLQVAARYEDYDGFDNVSPKIAGLWSVTDSWRPPSDCSAAASYLLTAPSKWKVASTGPKGRSCGQGRRKRLLCPARMFSPFIPPSCFGPRSRAAAAIARWSTKASTRASM